MKNNVSILVIDDEIQILKLLKITLGSADFKVVEAQTGKEGIQMAAMHPPNLIILDLGLPDIDGQEVLIKLRDWYNSPIIILSVKNSEEEIVNALDHGANDYLIKPFRTAELIARIRSTLRNYAKADNVSVILADNLNIDLANRTVKKEDKVIHLTSTEYTLLAILAKNANRVLTHQFLLKEIWGATYIEQTQYLRVFIAQIRKKIEDNPNQPTIILTEPAIGYRFVSD